jgi:hypothetical protein
MSENQDHRIEAERRGIVQAILGKLHAEGVEVNHLTVGERCERDFPSFEYDCELDDYRLLDSTEPVTAEMAAKEAADTASTDHAKRVVLEDGESLREKYRALDQDIANLRARIASLTAARQQARGRLADAIQLLTKRIPRLTPEQNTRQFLAASVRERELKALQGREDEPAGARGRSKLDRNAAWSRSGDPAERRLQTGHRRGSLPASARGMRIPSERA